MCQKCAQCLRLNSPVSLVDVFFFKRYCNSFGRYINRLTCYKETPISLPAVTSSTLTFALGPWLAPLPIKLGCLYGEVISA